MKHVVFIVGSYYPYYSAVGKCIGNIASEFEKEYKVTVICEKNIVGQLNEEILGRQRIVRITTKIRYNRIRTENALKEAKGIKKVLFKILLVFFKLVRYLKVALSKAACDSDLIDAYVNALNELEEKIDIIVPTCIPFEGVIAALNFKEKKPRVDIVPYLFDLFAENRNVNRGRLLQKMHWKANIKCERKMFEEAKAIFYVTNWTKHIERCFPEYKTKSHEVEHPLLVCKRNVPLIPADNAQIHVVYTGVVDTSIRNPERTLEVLAKLQMCNVRFDFYSYGSGEKYVEEYSSLYESIVAHGKVDSEEAQQAMSQAGVLLSIGNTDNLQVPSKLIEYIAMGKPIIHFAQNKEDASLELLGRYPIAKIVDLSSEIDLEKLEIFIREHEKKVLAFDEVMELFGNASPEYVANEISKICKNPGEEG